MHRSKAVTEEWQPECDVCVQRHGDADIVEIYYGEAETAKFELVTDAVVRTESAKEYVAGKRLYGYVEGDLLYAYDMAAVGQELQPHTWARLQRA